jgi:hypothetical protein
MEFESNETTFRVIFGEHDTGRHKIVAFMKGLTDSGVYLDSEVDDAKVAEITLIPGVTAESAKRLIKASIRGTESRMVDAPVNPDYL